MSAWLGAISKLNFYAGQLASEQGTEFQLQQVQHLADALELDVLTRQMLGPIWDAPTLPPEPRPQPPATYTFHNYSPDNRYPREPSRSGSAKKDR